MNADNNEDFDFRDAEHRGDLTAIKDHAEMTGQVYSLSHFQDACNDEEINIANSFILFAEESKVFKSAWFANYYRCPNCGNNWDGEFDSLCDDDCECGEKVTPHYSEQIK